MGAGFYSVVSPPGAAARFDLLHMLVEVLSGGDGVAEEEPERERDQAHDNLERRLPYRTRRW